MGKVEDVAKILRDIRDKEKNDRKDCCVRLLNELGYKKNTSVSMVQFDAFLIKATIEHFDVSPKSDIVLMAFGLLKGYEYQTTTISVRRKKYLQESYYLQTNPRSKIKNFDGATKEEQEKEINNIRNGGECRPITSLAEFLIKQNIAEYIKNLDGYMTKGKNPKAILPKPSYSLPDFPDETGPASTDTEAEVRHVENINSNQNTNTVVVQINNVIRGTVFQSESDKSSCGPNNTSGDALLDGGTNKPKGHKRWHIYIPIACLCVIVLFFATWSNRLSTPLDGEIQVLADEVTIQSGDIYQVKPMLVSDNSEDITFEYTSSNPDILKVLYDGLLYAQNDLPEGESASVEVTIRGPYDTTKKVSFTIESLTSSDYPKIDPDNFKIAYTIENQVRLVGGDKTWGNSVEAKIGDKVEFRMAYQNNGTGNQMNVMINTMLPEGLRYIPGSTTLKSGNYPNGAGVVEDDIIGRGINIGGYAGGANAFVRFQAEVVDEGLECGSNSLVNWGQASVNKTSLQDYAVVHVNKD